ncbi:IclR family transcriptional regulator [Halanaerobium congolense]|jgi:DNA-binding IclR family transcriptional regulator|uniref:DNA-binding IclR family transcriptional regulator n=1 Tax=Halanaerobium congolense TaxID=54121 RepID=A0A4R7DYK3_9FIRM|nr:IclR family transcriptional regulator [Halanaerobium congolense]TDS25712.1 DNA-binding IclR family transcriptional regulator [Halanaerobium congolense]
MNRMELRSAAKPILQKLSDECKETIHLVIYDRGSIIYIDKIESTRSVQINSQIGKRLPAYCTGVGKVLLAYLDEKELNQYIDRNEFKKYTPNTITDKDLFREELKKIRNRGYGIDDREYDCDLRCVAAPIRNYTSEVIGAISISVPKERGNGDAIKNLKDLVIKGSEKISMNLGYNPNISV